MCRFHRQLGNEMCNRRKSKAHHSVVKFKRTDVNALWIDSEDSVRTPTGLLDYVTLNCSKTKQQQRGGALALTTNAYAYDNVTLHNGILRWLSEAA